MKGWLFAAALFALTALAQTFQVVSGEARYRVREELLQVGLTDAVGTTKAVRGEVRLQDGRVSGEFVVDLRELKSDQARRDNYLRQRTLETDRYPFATFRPKEVRASRTPAPARQGAHPGGRGPHHQRDDGGGGLGRGGGVPGRRGAGLFADGVSL